MRSIINSSLIEVDLNIYLIAAIIAWVGLSYNVGIGARVRGQQFLTFFIMALCASPLIAAFVLLLRTPTNGQLNYGLEESICPFCRESVSSDALICKWCKRTLPESKLRAIYYELLLSDPTLIDKKNEKKLLEKAKAINGIQIEDSKDYSDVASNVIKRTSIFSSNSSLFIFIGILIAFLFFGGFQLFQDRGTKEEWIYLKLDFNSVNKKSPCEGLSENYSDIFSSNTPSEENKVSIISENSQILGAGYLNISGYSLLNESSPKNLISQKSGWISNQSWISDRDETPYHVSIFEEKNSCRYIISFPFADDEPASAIQVGFRAPVEFNFIKPSRFFNDGIWDIEVPILPITE